MESKIALVTGATSGIGRATAIALAKEGYHIIGCGRRKERLEPLRQELPKGVNYTYLVFDVRNKEAVDQAIDSLPNAGKAHGLDPIQTGDTEDWDAMLDINVKGLLYVSRKIIPRMVARKQGQIINVGSIAAKEVYPKGNVYCASKQAVDALTAGMRLDLNPFGIKVMGIHPGAVETEFSNVRFKGDDQKADAVYQGFKPLVAGDIAEIIAFAVTRPVHVVMADVVILPVAQASATTIYRDK
jgi:3-hydroxy acid dehydrogenase/malonic semialdehyde reductase